ncbi:MAG: HEAT repeat domain-containing protein, partial [Methanomicrobiales archaeon]|nr:HEAT repeat domain-containing protein [Methanomicrobiales archaeon]
MAQKPDIGGMAARGDIKGLIRLLRSTDLDVQWHAAQTLGQVGGGAMDQILASVRSRNRDIRLGLIEALGEIGDPSAVPVLLELLKDGSLEVRWAVAIALGEIGDPRAIPALVTAVQDTDKYVRYGAAISLEKVGWSPRNDVERAWLAVGKQHWDEISKIGPASLDPLANAFRDRNADVRVKVIEVLGELASADATPVLMQALRDENPAVRWKAVLAAPRCGISHRYLPRGIAKRPRVRKNPRIAAFLNFILPGQGYNY